MAIDRLSRRVFLFSRSILHTFVHYSYFSSVFGRRLELGQVTRETPEEMRERSQQEPHQPRPPGSTHVLLRYWRTAGAASGR